VRAAADRPLQAAAGLCNIRGRLAPAGLSSMPARRRLLQQAAAHIIIDAAGGRPPPDRTTQPTP
jgi:hypothetical protein